jgi:hypothetical protein
VVYGLRFADAVIILDAREERMADTAPMKNGQFVSVVGG